MEEHLKQHEGQLLKFTNVMKGWQNRWFILDPWTGVLEYYLVCITNRFLLKLFV